MENEQFWQLIEQSKNKARDCDKQATRPQSMRQPCEESDLDTLFPTLCEKFG
jgi:hypothetical protein